jgi:hypothetical protein
MNFFSILKKKNGWLRKKESPCDHTGLCVPQCGYMKLIIAIISCFLKGLLFLVYLFAHLFLGVDLVLGYPYEGGEQKGKPANIRE